MNAIHAADKGVAYERWATNFNTNAASKSLWDLQIYCGGSYDTLVQKADAAAAHCRELVKAIYIEARTSPAASGIRASAFPMTLWALSRGRTTETENGVTEATPFLRKYDITFL